jgi:hypothetical protein
MPIQFLARFAELLASVPPQAFGKRVQDALRPTCLFKGVEYDDLVLGFLPEPLHQEALPRELAALPIP